MRVRVQSLGAIQRADIELKPLTVFVGPNNAGKTWMAYTLASILGEYGTNEYVKFLLSSNKIQEEYPSLDTLIQTFLHEGSVTLDIVQFATQTIDTYFKRVGSRARNWMRDYLGTKRASFKSLKVDISLTDPDILLKRVLNYSIDTGFPRGPQSLVRAVKNEANPIFYFYAEERISEKLPPQEIKTFLLENIFRAIQNAVYSQVYTFPTERTTLLSLLSGIRMASIAGSAMETVSQVQANTLFPNSLGSFFTIIFSVLTTDPFIREEEAKTNPAIRKYLSIAHLLEQGILNGEIETTSSALDILIELLFKPTRDVSLEMQVASSMVKELSPFILYLRSLAKPGQLLVIDEPEMNLHPAAQVRFMELLAMLVNNGLNVLFTTHSTYMVDHLVNLIKASNIQPKEEIQHKFFLNSTDAFLSKEQVSVYLFEDRQAHSILDEHGAINWSTFSTVSDQLTDIFLELVEREVRNDS